MNQVEGFKLSSKPSKTDEFFFRTGLKLQQLKADRAAFVYRDTLYLVPLSKSIFYKTIEFLVQKESDWAVLRSLLEMSTPVSLTVSKSIRP